MGEPTLRGWFVLVVSLAAFSASGPRAQAASTPPRPPLLGLGGVPALDVHARQGRIEWGLLAPGDVTGDDRPDLALGLDLSPFFSNASRYVLRVAPVPTRPSTPLAKRGGFEVVVGVYRARPALAAPGDVTAMGSPIC